MTCSWSLFTFPLKIFKLAYLAWEVARLPCNQGGLYRLYPKHITLILGTVGFLLGSSATDHGPFLQLPLCNFITYRAEDVGGN
jgi:hypothetical protein